MNSLTSRLLDGLVNKARTRPIRTDKSQGAIGSPTIAPTAKPHVGIGILIPGFEGAPSGQRLVTADDQMTTDMESITESGRDDPFALDVIPDRNML